MPVCMSDCLCEQNTAAHGVCLENEGTTYTHVSSLELRGAITSVSGLARHLHIQGFLTEFLELHISPPPFFPLASLPSTLSSFSLHF